MLQNKNNKPQKLGRFAASALAAIITVQSSVLLPLAADSSVTQVYPPNIQGTAASSSQIPQDASSSAGISSSAPNSYSSSNSFGNGSSAVTPNSNSNSDTNSTPNSGAGDDNSAPEVTPDNGGSSTPNSGDDSTVPENPNNGNGDGGSSIPPAFSCNHQWDDGTIVKKATCSEEGLMVFHCVKCGEEMGKQKLSKLNHKLPEKGVVVQEPTIYDVGQENFYCTVCGELAKVKAIPPLPWPKPGETVPPGNNKPTPNPNPKPGPDTSNPTPKPTPNVPAPNPGGDTTKPEETQKPCLNHEWVSGRDCRYCKHCGAVDHYHSFSSNWRYNETGHWKECLVMDCGQRKEWSEHDWITVNGHKECRYCGYVQGGSIAPTPPVINPNPPPAPNPNPYYPPYQPQPNPQPNPQPQVPAYRPGGGSQPTKPLDPVRPIEQNRVHGATTNGYKDVLKEEQQEEAKNNINEQFEKPEETPVPSTAPVEEAPKANTQIAVTVPLYFTDAAFDDSGKFFVGNLPFQTDRSVPVEVTGFALEAQKKWNLVPYEGEDHIKGKDISVVVNRCMSTKDGFDFNPKYFTTPIPENGLMELPYKVCVEGPNWTSAEEPPLRIVVTIRACR